MHKGIIGALLAIIILGGGFYLFTKNKEAVDVLDSDTMIEKHDDSMMEEGDTMMAADLPAEGLYVLEPEASSLSFGAERIVGNSHKGSVTISDGSLTFSESGVTGNFTVDMATISESENNERFLGHIKSEDFFNIETYPTATFSITSVTKGDEGMYVVTGNLTILDKTNEISFPATFSADADGASAQAAFSIDRTKWDITYDSGSIFSELGDKAIRDEIVFELDLSFNKQ